MRCETQTVSFRILNSCRRVHFLRHRVFRLDIGLLLPPARESEVGVIRKNRLNSHGYLLSLDVTHKKYEVPDENQSHY